MRIEDADDWVEKIARFLWDLVADYDGVQSWDVSDNQELKRKYREAADIVIRIMPIILGDDDK